MDYTCILNIDMHVYVISCTQVGYLVVYGAVSLVGTSNSPKTRPVGGKSTSLSTLIYGGL